MYADLVWLHPMGWMTSVMMTAVDQWCFANKSNWATAIAALAPVVRWKIGALWCLKKLLNTLALTSHSYGMIPPGKGPLTAYPARDECGRKPFQALRKLMYDLLDLKNMPQLLILNMMLAMMMLCGCTQSDGGGVSQSGSVQRQFYAYDHCYYLEDDASGTKVLVFDSTTKLQSELQIDRPVQYIHLIPNRGGFIVDKEGQVGIVNWVKESSTRAAARTTIPKRLADYQIGPIIAWAHMSNVQAACDKKGRLLITNAQTWNAKIVTIPQFPSHVERLLVTVIEENDGASRKIVVSGLVDRKVWTWSTNTLDLEK